MLFSRMVPTGIVEFLFCLVFLLNVEARPSPTLMPCLRGDLGPTTSFRFAALPAFPTVRLSRQGSTILHKDSRLSRPSMPTPIPEIETHIRYGVGWGPTSPPTTVKKEPGPTSLPSLKLATRTINNLKQKSSIKVEETFGLLNSSHWNGARGKVQIDVH